SLSPSTTLFRSSGDRLGHILDAPVVVSLCLLSRVDVHDVVSIPVVVSGSSTGGVNQRPTVEACTPSSSAMALFDQPASRSRAARSRRPSTSSASGSVSGFASDSIAATGSVMAGSSGGVCVLLGGVVVERVRTTVRCVLASSTSGGTAATVAASMAGTLASAATIACSAFAATDTSAPQISSAHGYHAP